MSDAPFTRLMLVSPELAETEAFLPVLKAALAAGDVAAVVLRLSPADDRTRLARAKPLIEAIQLAGAAALIAGESGRGHRRQIRRRRRPCLRRGRRRGGDRAFPARQDRRRRRHPLARRRDGGGRGRRRLCAVRARRSCKAWPADETLERVEWWVPIFEVPCVGFAASLDDVAPIAAAQAEFVALGDAVWRHDGGAAAGVIAAGAALSLAKAPAP